MARHRAARRCRIPSASRRCRVARRASDRTDASGAAPRQTRARRQLPMRSRGRSQKYRAWSSPLGRRNRLASVGGARPATGAVVSEADRTEKGVPAAGPGAVSRAIQTIQLSENGSRGRRPKRRCRRPPWPRTRPARSGGMTRGPVPPLWRGRNSAPCDASPSRCPREPRSARSRSHPHCPRKQPGRQRRRGATSRPGHDGSDAGCSRRKKTALATFAKAVLRHNRGFLARRPDYFSGIGELTVSLKPSGSVTVNPIGPQPSGAGSPSRVSPTLLA